MKNILGFFAVIGFLIPIIGGCNKKNKDVPNTERFYINNTSAHDVLLECFIDGEVALSKEIKQADTVFIIDDPAHSKRIKENPIQEDYDSINVTFNQEKILYDHSCWYIGLTSDQLDLFFNASNCRYPKQPQGCDRTFTLTEEDYNIAVTL